MNDGRKKFGLNLEHRKDAEAQRCQEFCHHKEKLNDSFPVPTDSLFISCRSQQLQEDWSLGPWKVRGPNSARVNRERLSATRTRQKLTNKRERSDYRLGRLDYRLGRLDYRLD